jgi:hypothetical protein
MLLWMHQSKTQNPPSKIPREVAQETAATFAAQQLADILQAGTPYLITTGHGLCWRVPLLLSHPALFTPTSAATLDISAQTGQPMLTAEQQHTLLLQIYQAFRQLLR